MKHFILLSAVYCLLSTLLTGCAGSRAYQKQEIDRLRSRVAQLESEVELRDKRMREMNESLSGKVQMQYRPSESKEPSVKEIQVALKNAGFDPGALDGKFGKKTKQALISFQKARGLEPDGSAGKKTWAKLGQYLQK